MRFRSTNNSLLNILILVIMFPRINRRLRRNRRIHQQKSSSFPIMNIHPSHQVILRNNRRYQFIECRRSSRIKQIRPPLMLLTTRLNSILTRQNRIHHRIATTLLLTFNQNMTSRHYRQGLQISSSILLFKRIRRCIKTRITTLLILSIMLNLMVCTFSRYQTIRSNFRRRLTPITLRLQITFRHINRINHLNHSTTIRLRRIFRLNFRLTPLQNLHNMSLFSPLTRINSIITRKFRRAISLLLANLTRTRQIFTRGFNHRIFRLHPRNLLRLFTLNLLNHALLNIFHPRQHRFHLKQNPRHHRLHFNTNPLFNRYLYLHFMPLTGLPFNQRNLLNYNRPNFNNQGANNNITFTHFNINIQHTRATKFPVPRRRSSNRSNYRTTNYRCRGQNQNRNLYNGLFRTGVTVCSQGADHSKHVQGVLTPGTGLFT